MFLRKVATKLGNPFTRLQAIRRYGYPAHAKTPKQVVEETKAGMDYLPVPEGSWQAAYQAKVSKGNQQMILAAVFFAVSVAVAWKTNTLYFHGAPDYKSIKVEVPYYKGEIRYRLENEDE
ncbi:hypothetical protein CHS0354_012637 [Potamilus streckersoni]|uniref:Deltamethrin resistance protein prag01 domain-containing protein n=1 Tax=Potamilus streckersoni TaxID=2493646 RepID=A0AAE0W3R3_9BIVA|nr:hypothetical protein CHS0354_012637 [Potamilus streckersoni]